MNITYLTNIGTFQLNCKYLGNRVENEIVEAVCAAPQLLKLGIALEFRDALNKTAIQLLKNLDRSKCSPYRYRVSLQIVFCKLCRC